MAFLWRLLPVRFSAGAMDRLTAFDVCIIRNKVRMELVQGFSIVSLKQHLRFLNRGFVAKVKTSTSNVASCDQFRLS